MSFEQLEAWSQARSATRSIYALTRTGRLARDFGLGNQTQRAVVSIMSNVAEGYERCHIPEKLQFYNIAAGSAAEVRSLTYVIEDNYPEAALSAVAIRRDVHRVSRLLSGLIRSTEARRPAQKSSGLFHSLLLFIGI